MAEVPVSEMNKPSLSAAAPSSAGNSPFAKPETKMSPKPPLPPPSRFPKLTTVAAIIAACVGTITLFSQAEDWYLHYNDQRYLTRTEFDRKTNALITNLNHDRRSDAIRALDDEIAGLEAAIAYKESRGENAQIEKLALSQKNRTKDRLKSVNQTLQPYNTQEP